MTPAEDGQRLVNLVVTNFSGGKRHAGRGPMDADAMPGTISADAMHEMVRLASSVRTSGGFVLAVQEMTTDDPALPTRAAAFEAALGHKARSSLVPRVSTAWYPLKEKWGEKIEPGGAHNEGLCVVTDDAGLALVPWATAPGPTAGPAAVSSPTRVLDLPNVSFPGTGEGRPPEGGWLRGSVVVNGTTEQISFRPTFYQGTRDSDPRVAQSCLLGWLATAGEDAYGAACVLINVHLSTLNSERQPPGVHGRVPTPEAIFLRKLQLDLIAWYVKELQEATGGLPVVIAGDFNAEPGSPEMLAFAERAGSVPVLSAGRCWKCGTPQEERPEVLFYASGPFAWDYTTHPQSPDQVVRLATRAVCSNGDCLEPRFTHKWHVQILDNAFIVPARGSCTWDISPGIPHVDVSWAYSDHAAIILPLNFTRRIVNTSDTRIGNAAQVRY